MEWEDEGGWSGRIRRRMEWEGERGCRRKMEWEDEVEGYNGKIKWEDEVGG